MRVKVRCLGKSRREGGRGMLEGIFGEELEERKGCSEEGTEGRSLKEVG